MPFNKETKPKIFTCVLILVVNNVSVVSFGFQVSIVVGNLGILNWTFYLVKGLDCFHSALQT